MADTLVSARISKAKKEAATKLLSTMGATTSDLINDAFDYLLSSGALPTVSASAPGEACNADFEDFVQRSTIKVDWGTGAQDGNYKKLIAEGRAYDYESLT